MRRLSLFFFSIFFCNVVMAHAGMYDRYLDMKISVEALVLVIAVCQLSAYLFLRYSKSQLACHYKKVILHIAKTVYRNLWLRWGMAWAISSFVCTPYVYGFSIELFFFAFIPMLIFLIYYCNWVWNKEKRRKRLTGIRPLSILLSVAFQQFLGYIVYALICETTWFHSLVFYTDEEYEMLDVKLYPGIEGFDYMAQGLLGIAFITAIPYVLLFIIRTIFYLFSVFRSKNNDKNRKERYKTISRYATVVAQSLWAVAAFAMGAIILVCWVIMTLGGLAMLFLKVLMLSDSVTSSLPEYMINYVRDVQEAFLLNGIAGWIQLLLFNLLMPLYVIGQFVDVKEAFRTRLFSFSKLFKRNCR